MFRAPTLRSHTAAASLTLITLALGGCQHNSFSADVRNQTPQPLGAAISVTETAPVMGELAPYGTVRDGES